MRMAQSVTSNRSAIAIWRELLSFPQRMSGMGSPVTRGIAASCNRLRE